MNLRELVLRRNKIDNKLQNYFDSQQERRKGMISTLTNQNLVNQSNRLNSEFSKDFNPSNESAHKFKPESAVIKYYQECSSESKINSVRQNEGSLPPLHGSKITVTMTDSNIYMPLSNKNKIFKDYIRREKYDSYNV